jgi:hypothetical protein
MKKTIRLTERDLTRLIKKIVNEQMAPQNQMDPLKIIKDCSGKDSITDACKKISTSSGIPEIIGCLASLGITDPGKAFGMGQCIFNKMSEFLKSANTGIKY